MSKSHRASFPISDSKATLPFDLIHYDVWGSVKVTSNGFRLCVIFIDDCTRLTWVFLMKNKSDVPLLLQEICAMRSKLDACALRCVVIGYANNQKGYKCYHHPTHKTDIAMDLPVSVSDELPSDDRLPTAGMSNELPHDGSSSDDSSKSLFDVKNAFFHGDLKEEVYMDLLPGIETSLGKGVVLTGDDQKEIQRLQKYLAIEFEMKELGELKYFLGIEIAHLSMVFFYLRGNNVVSRFMHPPSEAHMDAVIRILRFLKLAPGRGLVFSKNGHLNVQGKKQKVVGRSSAEAEFCGMSHGIDRHFINEKLDAGIIMFPFVGSAYQLIDVLTKGVPKKHETIYFTDAKIPRILTKESKDNPHKEDPKRILIPKGLGKYFILVIHYLFINTLNADPWFFMIDWKNCLWRLCQMCNFIKEQGGRNLLPQVGDFIKKHLDHVRLIEHPSPHIEVGSTMDGEKQSLNSTQVQPTACEEFPRLPRIDHMYCYCGIDEPST
ncbi:polyprotein (retrotrasposon protein) [Pyrus ussuriensis x Pyrus communis]|uniref:Polyprotein (Retrotrasposon protein) n=1 Tax=Pyrus ussuriensis x Pyrus communis TaxID=2448454 RepID=A0A5N5FFX6_9ROSA|nr:polyprotein (retrotrasposon protein) [Pyrus ussuriensis x Pyrus communis]